MDQTYPTQCELCRTPISTPEHRAMHACDRCARKLGIIPMPPSRRPPRPCVRCNGLHFVRVIPREYTSDDGGDWNRQMISPMYATAFPPKTDTSWLHGTYLKDLVLGERGIGILEMHELVDLTPDTQFRG